MTTSPADIGKTEAFLYPPDRLDEIIGGWDALAERALEPNVFLSRWMAEARIRHLPDGAGARVLAAFREEAGSRRLVGLMLLVRPSRRRFNPLPVLRAAELYAPLSTPLMDPERPGEVWAAMVAALDRAGIVALALPELARDGPVAAALRGIAEVSHLPVVSLGNHQRAMLASPLSGTDYVRVTLERRRRREVERQRRRLAELGRLEVIVAPRDEDLGVALDRFLMLESSGWKGNAGTDLAHAPGAAAYFRQAASAAPQGALRVVSLMLEGKAVAAGIVAVAGRRAFYVKTAYDEALSRFSPGLLLTLDLTAHLLDDPTVVDADSVADGEHPMIDRVWTERLAIESVLVGTRPGGSLAFQAALAAERAREATIAFAKKGIAALRNGK